ncbi:hypothetical protein NDU88_006097, partial [Pleurodeles waltl]
SCRSQGQCIVHSRAADNKDTVRSALKSRGSKGHCAQCSQEMRITRTRRAVHSRDVDHKDTAR